MGFAFFSVWLFWVATLAIIDVADHRLPNGLTLCGYPFSLGWVAYSQPQGVQSALATGIACITVGYGAYRFADLGFGDVKLLGSVGILVGGSGELVTALVAASTIAGVHALVVLVRTRNTRTFIPFGPALLAATAPAALVLV